MVLDRSTIQQHDSHNMLGSLEVFEKQCTAAFHATQAIEFPDNLRNVDRIVLFGMGGSALGMHVVQTLFADSIPLPISIVNDYNIPAYVRERSLVILSSYSGTTEEVLHVAQHIRSRTKNILVMTTGGDLATFATQHNIPGYIFQPRDNPSNQPRVALGYAVMGLIGMLAKLGLVTFTAGSMTQIEQMIVALQKVFHPENDHDNRAKMLAFDLHGTIPVLIAAEFLEGAAHVFANQINENAKQFCVRFAIPEMNHHLVEGFVSPANAVRNLRLVFLESPLYFERNRTRFRISADIAAKNNIASTRMMLHGTSSVEQVFECLLLGGYASFYMALLNDRDPSPIPNIDYLKQQLQNREPS